MRFSDIKLLSEESLNLNTFGARNPNYWRNLINRIRANQPITMRTGSGANALIDVTIPPEFADKLEKIWNPSGTKAGEVADVNQIAMMKGILVPTEDGGNYRLNQVEKTKDIKQKVGVAGEKTNSKWWNKGNVAEGIMACAVITKFERHGDVITGEDIFHTAQRLTTTSLSTESYGKRLDLQITLSSNDFAALQMSAQQPQEFLQFDKSKEIYKLYVDSATYVNESANVQSAIEKIKNASPKDVIKVTADGATSEAQHSTKADLWIAVGNKKERLLSIKTATVKHIGAVSGYEFDHINNFFMSTVGFGLPEDLKKSFKAPPVGLPKGHKKSDPVPQGYVKMTQAERSAKIAAARAYNYTHGTKKAYQYVFKRIKELTAGPVDQSDYDFVTTVTKGVVHHATLGEDVRLVIISPSAKKAYTELEFGPKLYEALQNYDLVPKLNLEGANYKLLVYGYPKTEKAKRVENDASMFVQLRSYVQDNAARNVVEIGGLLKNLTDVSKLEATASKELGEPVFAPQPQATPATTPVNAKPATTQQVSQPQATEPATTTQPEEPDELNQVKRNAGLI
jgi:hypothetical protein